MKSTNILFMAIVMTWMPFSANAQDEEKAAPLRVDSVSLQLKIQQLEQQKSRLAKKIEAEDRKRNQAIAGVSAENMEIINFRQDSLCLALRSEMTDIELNIDEHKAALHALATPTEVIPNSSAATTTQQTNPSPTRPQIPAQVQQTVNALNRHRPNRK